MFGEEYMNATIELAAENALLDAVRRCKTEMSRDRLELVLAYHAHRASKGRHTGDSDWLGEPCPATAADD